MPFTVAIADDRSERSGREMDHDDQYFPQSMAIDDRQPYLGPILDMNVRCKVMFS